MFSILFAITVEVFLNYFMYSTQEMSDESLKEQREGNALGNTDLVKKSKKEDFKVHST